MIIVVESETNLEIHYMNVARYLLKSVYDMYSYVKHSIVIKDVLLNIESYWYNG